MPEQVPVVIHPPEDWLRRYVQLALPIVKRALEQRDRTDEAGQAEDRERESA